MEENTYWLGLWSVVSCVVVTIIITIGVNCYNTQTLISKADTCEKAVILQQEQNAVVMLQLCKGNK